MRFAVADEAHPRTEVGRAPRNGVGVEVVEVVLAAVLPELLDGVFRQLTAGDVLRDPVEIVDVADRRVPAARPFEDCRPVSEPGRVQRGVMPAGPPPTTTTS